jgi:hypothetical protein
MKSYKKRAKCYCDVGPYRCEICKPNKKEKRNIKRGEKQKVKYE